MYFYILSGYVCSFSDVCCDNFCAIYSNLCAERCPCFAVFGYEEFYCEVSSADTATWEEIMAYMEENGYTFPVLKDETGEFFYYYGIQSFPITFLIKADGNVMGYVPGAMTKDIMLSVIDQTLAAYPVTPSVTEEPAAE